MAQKWNLQDIVPPDRPRRTTRRAAPSTSTRAPRRSSKKAVEAAPVAVPPERVALGVEEKEGRKEAAAAFERIRSPRAQVPVRRYAYALLAVLVILGIGGGITYLLSGAEVKVTPKHQEVNVQGTFTAKLEPDAGDLGYEILMLEADGDVEVRATGQEEAKVRAEGTIKVFNTYGTAPQRLIKNTRFQSKDGKIYHAADSIVIPGYTKNAAGEIVPGSVTARVFAAGTGDSYNTTNQTFTVPGLSGEQHQKIYAQTDGAGITGGFEGMRFILDEAALAAARENLHNELKTQMLARVKTERPNGFVLFEPSAVFTFESLPPEGAGEQTARIKEHARLHIPLFNQVALAPFMARSLVAGYGGEPVRLESPEALTFTYSAPVTELPSKESIDFSLTGKTRVIWNFDAQKLKKDLIGLKEDALLEVLASYPAIQKAEAVIRPIWKDSFPENLEDIKVTEVLPSGQ